MRSTTILLAIYFLFGPGALQAQSPLQVTPEATYTLPTEGFKGDNLLTADRGQRYGLHLNKMWDKFGLGVYGGYSFNDFSPRNLFPPNLDGSVLNYRAFANFSGLRWKGYQAAIGPVVQFGNKINIQLFTKVGGTVFDHRAYRYSLSVAEPAERQYTLFQVNDTETEKNYNLLLLSGLRVNIPLSGGIGLSLGADYTHIRDVTHSYTYLDAEFSPDVGEEEIIEILSTAPTVTEVRECHFNSIGLTAGITIRFGSRRPDDPITGGPSPITPTNPDFSCDEFTYQAPGFNDVYTLREKNRVTFEWAVANVPEMQYELVLYARDNNGSYRNIYSTITSQNRHTLDLNDINGILNDEVHWEVNPLVGGADFCPYTNTKMRIHVFKNRQAAEKALPGCKL